MPQHFIPFEQAGVFSSNDTAYATLDGRLAPFYLHRPELGSFPEVIRRKAAQPVDRKTLVQVLREQYGYLDASEASLANIALLEKEATFTITTAHQPALFTGPLYYIYKIISAINLSRKLNATYPDYHFVPVFVTGGEDHDFEEINHAKIFREKVVWESSQNGSVGKMSTMGIHPLLDQLESILGDSPNAQKIAALIRHAHEKHDTYSRSALELANLLFKDKGLVVLDMGHPDLKRIAIPIFRKEITDRPSERLVNETKQALAGAGFKPQAFARPINLFYLGEGFRERIVREGAGYAVLNQNLHFSEAGLLLHLSEHPERFSPNVVMRPLYQELILPNLAYIGGGGELAYWLERKAQFEHFGLPYPMLIRRDSVLWIDTASAKKMQKWDISLAEIWEDDEILVKKYVRKTSEEELNFSSEKQGILKEYGGIIAKLEAVDANLSKPAKAELAKAMKGLENLENKMLRAEKRKHETATNGIRNLKAKLFPEGNLQERKDNFIPFYVKYGDDFFEELYGLLDCMDRRVKIVIR